MPVTTRSTPMKMSPKARSRSQSKNQTIIPKIPKSSIQYSVILPTFNERENLPIIIHLLHATFTEIKTNFEVIIVEDNSPDGTLLVAQSLQSSYVNADGSPIITILPRKGKLGLGSAYMDGLKVSERSE